MAQIKLNATLGLEGTLPAISGANLTSLNASNISSGTLNSARFSGGKVLQVQEFHYTTYLARTDNSSFSDGLHVDITPSASDSKILVMGAGQFTKGGVTEVIYRMFRQTGGTGDSGWSTDATRVGTDVGAWTGSTSQANHTSGNVLWLDSPATTSALRYVFAWTTYDNGVSAQINNYNAGGASGSQIVAMEVGA